MLDVNILKPNEHYSALKKRKSIVIFITEKDVLGEGEPIYIIDRVIQKSGKPFNADKAGEIKGVKEVGVLDDWEREVEARGEARKSENIAQNLIRLGTIALDEIAKACGLPLQRVQELADGK